MLAKRVDSNGTNSSHIILMPHILWNNTIKDLSIALCFFPEMTFFAFLLFSPILLLGVDGHGALVWPPNWTDGHPIPLDQRLNSPNFCCSLKFWTLSSMHRCPLNCLSIFKGCFHDFATAHTRWNKSIVGPYKDAGTGWGYNYSYSNYSSYSMSTDQVENIEANILAKVKPFCQAYIRGHGNEYQSKGEVNHKQNKQKQRTGWGSFYKPFFKSISNTVNIQVTNKNWKQCGKKCRHDKTPWSSPGCLLCLSESTLKQLYNLFGK